MKADSGRADMSQDETGAAPGGRGPAPDGSAAGKATTASRVRPERASRPRRGGLAISSNYGLPITWLFMVLLFGVLMPNSFLSPANGSYILSSQATLLIVAIGVTVALAAGEFDLSSSGTLTMCLVVVGYLNVQNKWPVLPTVLVALAIGLLVGGVNAVLAVAGGINSLIVTLAMGSVLLGASLGINNLTVSGISPTLVNVARSTAGGIQLVFFYAIALAVVAWYVLQHTALGRKLFFTGAGREVARLSGIRVDAIRAGALIVSSVCAALAGVLLAGVLGSADPNAGVSYMLAPFAATMLGATSFTPGRYNIPGTTVATYFLATGIAGLQLLGLSGWISQVFYGVALILGVGLSAYASRMISKTRGGRSKIGRARNELEKDMA